MSSKQNDIDKTVVVKLSLLALLFESCFVKNTGLVSVDPLEASNHEYFLETASFVYVTKLWDLEYNCILVVIA